MLTGKQLSTCSHSTGCRFHMNSYCINKQTETHIYNGKGKHGSDLHFKKAVSHILENHLFLCIIGFNLAFSFPKWIISDIIIIFTIFYSKINHNRAIMSNCIKVSIRNIWAMHMINISMRFFRCRWEFISWQCTLSSLVWRSLLGEQNYCLRVSHMFSESWVAPCLVCLVWHMELCNLFKCKTDTEW